METQKEEYVLSMFEVCELLNKSKRSVSRYVRRGLLRPIQIKSRQGTLEYRFSEIEVKDFKEGQPRQDYTEGTGRPGQDRQEQGKYEEPDFREHSPQTRQDQPDTKDGARLTARSKAPEESGFAEETRRDTQEKTEQKGHDSQDGFVALLKRTVETLSQQLKTKDDQLAAKDKHIDSLLERNREMNVLLKFLQDKYPALEAPKRRGRKAKEHASEAEAFDITGRQPEARIDEQGPQEAQEPPQGEKETVVEPAVQEAAAEEPETPQEEEKKPKEKSEKKGFWKKLFTPYTLP